MTSRRGDWWHEKDGDFNPGWVGVFIAAMIGCAGCAVIFIRVMSAASGADVVVLVGMAFAFLLAIILCLLTGVYSLGRVKVLHDSKVLPQLARTFDVDERDEDQRARAEGRPDA